jgi:hypothetical protein
VGRYRPVASQARALRQLHPHGVGLAVDRPPCFGCSQPGLKRPRRVKSERRPFPEWADYRKNSIWIYDCTHFAGCPQHAVFAVMDLVTRYWICELVSIEETSTQVQVVFMDALETEGLLELVEARQDMVPADTFPFDVAVAEPELPPILLAVSDNGPQMTSGSTREFMAMCAIAQHFGRPGTPRIKPGSRACSDTSKRSGRTSTASKIPRCSALSSPTSAGSTTQPGSMPGSVTSPHRTSIRAAARRSVPLASAGYDRPAGHESPTIESNKPKPNAGARKTLRNSLPDLWL